ncbi:hypothetical protein [Sphingomonas dokdonensis]|uniref:Uncharacterized protein n=1 Tax=Sphingomonas dokdonensis TaxID=344880 RepID=A0A245ZD22_9SPHN|nr:hypothetical protein [Sphingomonas dokdonensis]OWK27593.1 hypothetical protein SPDO_32760 [Sphingomonas dokdonensis]
MQIDGEDVSPAVHFVAFRGDEYWSAVKLWGRPAFIHRRWDQRARRELHPADTVVFAKGTSQDTPSQFNGADIEEGL